MATLYVSEPGVQVHKQGQRLLVKRGTEVLQDLPLIKIDRVVLMGPGVSLTTPALYTLTRQNIDVLYLNSRGGYISRLVGREHKHSRLRQLQAIATTDQQQALDVARSIVMGKVNNQRVLVRRHVKGAGWARSALARMDDMRKQAEKAKSLDELRGREGFSAKEYFKLLRRIFKPPSDGKSWEFNRRAYYPPTDPINALLSFGYTLLLNDLIAACQTAGLDPDLGFFHAVDYGKPAMALDLEEEFRSVIVDSIVLTAINRPLFGLKDFEFMSAKHNNDRKRPVREDRKHQSRPVHLKEAARKRFISLYEMRLNEQSHYPPSGERTTYRRILTLQAYQMAKVILKDLDRYEPVSVR